MRDIFLLLPSCRPNIVFVEINFWIKFNKCYEMKLRYPVNQIRASTVVLFLYLNLTSLNTRRRKRSRNAFFPPILVPAAVLRQLGQLPAIRFLQVTPLLACPLVAFPMPFYNDCFPLFWICVLIFIIIVFHNGCFFSKSHNYALFLTFLDFR